MLILPAPLKTFIFNWGKSCLICGYCNLIIKERNGVSFYQFPNLVKFTNIRHGIFTRKGGFSKNPYQSLNVSYDLGDDETNVKQNRNIVSQCLDEKELVFAKQVHGTNIIKFIENKKDYIQEISDTPLVGDAMITNIPGKNLVVQIADCQSIFMYDPVVGVIANVHSGWRGSINNITSHAILMMKKNFGCNPPDIVASISPSLGPCCSEFINFKKEIPKKFWEYRDGSNHFDFWSATRDQLNDAGVLSENIYLSRICTKCSKDLFFSYRGEGVTGRFAAVIGLK